MTKNKKSLFINVFDFINRYIALLYIFIGGRGIGKTYSALSESIESNKRFMYVRRTETELEKCCNELGNPFKKLNKDKGWNVHLKVVNKIIGIYDGEKNLIGYASSLSTFGNLRGVDFEDVEYIIFDEFINTSIRQTLKSEFNMLANMIETVNRNREMLGEESIKVILLSNANTIDDDIIRVLRLGEIIKRMKMDKGYGEYYDEERGLYLNLLDTPQEFYDKKEQTRLYKLTKGTSFHEMALSNQFVNDYFHDVKRVDFKELYPLFSYDDLYVYRHKSKNLIFISTRKASVSTSYSQFTHDLFLRQYGMSVKNYIERGLILYSDYDVKLKFNRIF